ncbi:MAG: zinc-binding dehydrogenase [Oscillospiraceae bacterium]|jgi:threonine dehydrogenase-like Zn-dependent dehydrogenase|nr:zinc-binding dehydrogenase [Oscillospiraceae bacterium]
MKTTALRLYGSHDVRVESFELPQIKEDEVLVKIISDSVCMSSYKAAEQGAAHKRVPDDVAENPTILGHEFCAEVVAVGGMVTGIKQGGRTAIQPALKGTYDAAGYSFANLGGCATYGIIPAVYIEQGNILPYEGRAAFYASLAEPVSCVIGAVHACYHTSQGDYNHIMDIKEGGKIAILAGAGPMGLALVDYLIHRDRKPSLLVVTDIDDGRLSRAASVLSPEEAKRNGVELRYVNPNSHLIPSTSYLLPHTFDEVFVFAPVAAVVEQAGELLAYDGCLNFFAGPTNTEFKALFNFYDVHYNAVHLVGTSGGNTDDMREALELAGKGRINPAVLVTHIGGLPAARETTLNLPKIPGGKKLIYTHIDIPLTAIEDFAKLGETDSLFAKLAMLCPNGLWNAEAEEYLLANAPKLT